MPQKKFNEIFWSHPARKYQLSQSNILSDTYKTLCTLGYKSLILIVKDGQKTVGRGDDWGGNTCAQKVSEK